MFTKKQKAFFNRVRTHFRKYAKKMHIQAARSAAINSACWEYERKDVEVSTSTVAHAYEIVFRVDISNRTQLATVGGRTVRVRCLDLLDGDF